MCGRFFLISDWGKIAEEFNLGDTNYAPAATGDIHPGQDTTCIISTGAGYKAENLHWGFFPKWAKQKSVSKLLINARAETLAEKPTFSKSFKERRCLIVADGFYEWTKEKRPFYFYLRNRKPLGLAGIYEPAIAPGDTRSSFVIITTDPNDLIAPLHGRMPVIIPADKRLLWLDNSKYGINQLQPLLVPYPSHEMEMRPAEFTKRHI